MAAGCAGLDLPMSDTSPTSRSPGGCGLDQADARIPDRHGEPARLHCVRDRCGGAYAVPSTQTMVSAGLTNLFHLAGGVGLSDRCCLLSCPRAAAADTQGVPRWVGPSPRAVQRRALRRRFFIGSPVSASAAVWAGDDLQEMPAGIFPIDAASAVVHVELTLRLPGSAQYGRYRLRIRSKISSNSVSPTRKA